MTTLEQAAPAQAAGEAVAWEIVCKKPGTTMAYATLDQDDPAHWPVDQWQSIEKRPLVYAAPQPAAPVQLTEAQIASACLSYRHDFGLLQPDERAKLMWQAKEWARALGYETPQPAAPAPERVPLTDEQRREILFSCGALRHSYIDPTKPDLCGQIVSASVLYQITEEVERHHGITPKEPT